MPENISGIFDCSNNYLETLEGSPKEINSDFICSKNNLTTLEGSSAKVKGSFDCSNNNLESLRGNLKEVGEYFNCSGNEKLIDRKQEIILNQIKAKKYFTNDGFFTYDSIKKEFEEYGVIYKKLLNNESNLGI